LPPAQTARIEAAALALENTPARALVAGLALPACAAAKYAGAGTRV